MRTKDYCYDSAAARLYCYCHTNPVTPSTTITSTSTTTTSTTIITTTTSSTTFTSTMTEDPVCDKAGVKYSLYTSHRHRYCRERCLGNRRSECYQSAPAKLYCYCYSNPSTSIISSTSGTTPSPSPTPPPTTPSPPTPSWGPGLEPSRRCLRTSAKAEFSK